MRQISGSIAAATGGPLKAEATITEPSEGKFHLRLVIRAGNLVSERNISAKSCKDLGGATAVALALLLSPDGRLSEPDRAAQHSNDNPSENRGNSSEAPTPKEGASNPSATPTAPAPAPAPPATPVLPTATEPHNASDAELSDERDATRRIHGLLVPFGALGWGPLTQPSVGLGLGLGASFERWRFLAEGTLWKAQHPSLSYLLDDYGAELQRFSIGLRGCHTLWGTRLELAPCLLMSVQHLAATGTGPNISPRTPSATWLAAGVGVQARLIIAPWLSFVAGVDAEFETAHPEVDLTGTGRVEQLSPAAATITLGSEWIL